MNSPLRRLASALFYSVPFYCGAQLLFEQSLQTSSVVRFYLSMALFLSVLIIVAQSVAVSLVEMIMGKQKKERVVSQSVYRIAERLVEKKRYHEAIYEYERIIDRHPQEMRAHMGLIQVLKENHRNPTYLEKALQRARQHCSTFDDYKTLSSQANFKN